MGTRNVTRVIYQGKMVVSQYGQWDGYPTGQLWTIVEFLQNKSNIDHLIKNLKKIIHAEDIPIDDKTFRDISEAVTFKKFYMPDGEETYFTALPTQTKFDEICKKGFSKFEAFSYLTATRDSGAKILDILISDYADKAMFIPLFILDEISWDIKGIYTVDLDKKEIYCDFCGYRKNYPIDRLPTYEELENYEKEVD